MFIVSEGHFGQRKRAGQNLSIFRGSLGLKFLLFASIQNRGIWMHQPQAGKEKTPDVGAWNGKTKWLAGATFFLLQFPGARKLTSLHINEELFLSFHALNCHHACFFHFPQQLVTHLVAIGLCWEQWVWIALLTTSPVNFFVDCEEILTFFPKTIFYRLSHSIW